MLRAVIAIVILLAGCREPGPTVMLGDSLTAQGQWGDRVNLGRGGDTSGAILARVSEVRALRPSHVYLLAGANDIGLGVAIGATIFNLQTIVRSLERLGTKVTVISVTYVASHHPDAEEVNAKVDLLNDAMRSWCSRRGTEFLDLNTQLSTGGYLNEPNTVDGVHLSPNAYAIWRGLLE